MSLRTSHTPLRRISRAVVASSLPGKPVVWLLVDGQDFQSTFKNWSKVLQFDSKEEGEAWLLNKKIEYNEEVWMNAFVVMTPVEEVFSRCQTTS